MAISTEAIRELRDRTGAGIMDCRRALEQAGGDQGKAMQIFEQQGLERMERRSGRVPRQGVIEAYIHAGGRIGAMVELNCETDFVARDDGFRQLARELAMQVAAHQTTEYVAAEDAPADLSDEEKTQKVLLLQGYIKNERQSVKDLITERTARYGEHVRIGRFARFELGA